MSVFIDTSALLALLDGDNTAHPPVVRAWSQILGEDEPLWCTNYVLVETCALTQRRLGMEALRAFLDDVVPVLNVHWLSDLEHAKAAAALIAANRRNLSLVDCASFESMRTRGLRKALTLDGHFAEKGFECLPELRA